VIAGINRWTALFAAAVTRAVDDARKCPDGPDETALRHRQDSARSAALSARQR
jgi:hypothetical protein